MTEALERRADLDAVAEQVEALALQARAVRAERWPRLEAVGRWQQTSGDPFRPAELFESSLALTWTPFAAGTRGPRSATFEAEREALAADLEELRRGVAVEVEDALARLAV